MRIYSLALALAVLGGSFVSAASAYAAGETVCTVKRVVRYGTGAGAQVQVQYEKTTAIPDGQQGKLEESCYEESETTTTCAFFGYDSRNGFELTFSVNHLIKAGVIERLRTLRETTIGKGQSQTLNATWGREYTVSCK